MTCNLRRQLQGKELDTFHVKGTSRLDAVQDIREINLTDFLQRGGTNERLQKTILRVVVVGDCFSVDIGSVHSNANGLNQLNRRTFPFRNLVPIQTNFFQLEPEQVNINLLIQDLHHHDRCPETDKNSRPRRVAPFLFHQNR